MIKKIGVLGLGKVGSLVATLLSQKFEVEGMDQFDVKDKFLLIIWKGFFPMEKIFGIF